jgi:hypothetical protein
MCLRVGEEFRQAALQLRCLLRTQVREQFFLELPCYGDGLCEQALTRSGQRDSQDATMLGSFPTFNQSLALEGADQIDDGLRTYADRARQLRTRGTRRFQHPVKQQELGGGQSKRRQSGFGTTPDGQLGTLQKIDRADGFCSAQGVAPRVWTARYSVGPAP